MPSPPFPPPYKAKGALTARMCSAMLRDPTHLFRRMWAAEAWGTMENGRPACWAVQREGWDRHGQPARRFFDQVENGAICGSNWYEGNGGMLGMVGGGPRFPRHPGSDRSTPALFGFDEAIDAHCAFQLGGWDKGPGGHAERCVAANRNILSLYGDRVPYNICRNLEWQVCAARGKLPYQGGRKIVFAVAPSSLDPSGATGKPLGQCKGWVPGRKPEGGFYGYATDDIFYLEVCMMNQICKNGEHLFHMQAGEEFQCDYDPARFRELQNLLLSPPEPANSHQQARCTHSTLSTMKERPVFGDDGLPDCSTCWRLNNGPGDCHAQKGCDSGRCDFCTNDPK